MGEKRNMQQWLDVAVSEICFKPDRKAAERELRDHLEDKKLDLQRLYHLTWREAEEMAVLQMGDPEPIGRELARLHRPWLGYLWRFSQIFAAAMVCMLLWGAVRSDGPAASLRAANYFWEGQQEGGQFSRALFEDGEAAWQGERLAVLEVGERARVGQSVISLEKAALWQEDERALYLQVRIAYDRPWQATDLPFDLFWAEDDLGNRYGADYLEGGSMSYQYRGTQAGLGWRSMNLRFSQVPEEARWMKLHYLPGTGLELRVDLSQEVAG